MLNALRPFISRLLAPFITAALAWAAIHWGLDFGTDAAGHITEYAVVVLLALFSAVNAVIHKSIDKKVNPVDAATAPLAVAGKVETTIAEKEQAVG